MLNKMNDFKNIPSILIPYLKDHLDEHGFMCLNTFNDKRLNKRNVYSIKTHGWRDYPLPMKCIFNEEVTMGNLIIFTTDNKELPLLWLEIYPESYSYKEYGPHVYFGTLSKLIIKYSHLKEILNKDKL